MEIFGIGPLELLLVFVLALIFIGPGKMPELAASLGKMLREFRAASAELTDALNMEIAEAERRKTAVTENGNGHSQADAAQAEVVAQGAIDAPPAIEFTSPEVINYQYEPPAIPPPSPVTTIDDVLGAIAQQEAEEAAKREAEEKARLDAIALERAIRNGVGPLPESLLLPTTDAPLVVVNPTEQRAPEPPATEVTVAPAEVVTEAVEPTVESDAAELADVETPTPTSNGEVPDVARAVEPEMSDGKLAEAEGESLEAAGARQAEVQ